MKKLQFIKFRMLLCLLLMAVCVVGVHCYGESVNYDHVYAYVHEDFRWKFDAREFTLEDFGLNNAEDFFYRYFGFDLDEKLFIIYLKKGGAKHANAAIKHLHKLEFIKKAEVNRGLGGPYHSEYIHDRVLAYIREEFYEKFDNREFTREDFNMMDNAMEFFYSDNYNRSDPHNSMLGPTSGDYAEVRIIFVRLITEGNEHVYEAVKHLKELEFVKRAELDHGLSYEKTHLSLHDYLHYGDRFD